MQQTSLLAGGTGLIGAQLLDLLVVETSVVSVYALTRREPESKAQTPSTKIQWIQTAFDRPDPFSSCPPVDAVFCCLGTTIKDAGSRDAFRKVDFTYPLRLAEWSAGQQVKSFHLVSAMGADADSRIFYNQVKGELEQAIALLSLPSVYIYRPSLLLGKRRAHRPGERIAQRVFPLLDPLLLGPLKPYRAIDSGVVAKAMLRQSLAPKPGLHVLDSDSIKRCAAESK